MDAFPILRGTIPQLSCGLTFAITGEQKRRGAPLFRVRVDGVVMRLALCVQCTTLCYPSHHGDLLHQSDHKLLFGN